MYKPIAIVHLFTTWFSEANALSSKRREKKNAKIFVCAFGMM